MIHKLTEARYRALCDEYSGLCRTCGEERMGDTEPDARDYPCEACGEDAVYGVEELLMMGEVEIVEEGE